MALVVAGLDMFGSLVVCLLVVSLEFISSEVVFIEVANLVVGGSEAVLEVG